MSELYLGTKAGVWAAIERGDRWEVVRQFAPDSQVNQLIYDGPRTTLYAATQNAGLLEIRLASGTLERLGAEAFPTAVRSVALSRDGRRMYVGTEPMGFYWSDDGGQIWAESAQLKQLGIERDWKFPATAIPVTEPHIRDIVVSAFDPNRIYAAAQVGGVLRSDDGGVTWIDSFEGIDPDVHSLVEHPLDRDTLYAAAGGGGFPGSPYPPPLPQGRPFYVSHDAGLTWNCISSDFERTYSVPLRIDRLHPNVMLGAVARGTPGSWLRRPEGADGVLMLSTDAGSTWERITGNLPERFAQGVEAIEFEGNGSQRVFVGVEDKIFCGAAPYQQWERLELDLPPILSIVAA